MQWQRFLQSIFSAQEINNIELLLKSPEKSVAAGTRKKTPLRKKIAFIILGGMGGGVIYSLSPGHRLVGLMVKASASRAEDPGFESRLRRDFSGSSHTRDLKIGTSVATLPGAWRYRVGAGTG